MPVSGDDPDDLDRWIERRLGGRLGRHLTAEDLRRYEEGASLVELLDEGDLDRLLAGRDADPFTADRDAGSAGSRCW